MRVQVLRPRLGYGSDSGGRRTPWIIGGMAVLAVGGIGAAVATALDGDPSAGRHCARGRRLRHDRNRRRRRRNVAAGAAGKTRRPETRRAAAATIVWVMMIVGLHRHHRRSPGICSIPISPASAHSWSSRSSRVAALIADRDRRVEHRSRRAAATPIDAQTRARRSIVPRRAARRSGREPRARRFAIFVFVSMLAYSAQDLILEPFAGMVFGFTPGESTTLSEHSARRRADRHDPGRAVLATLGGRRVAGLDADLDRWRLLPRRQPRCWDLAIAGLVGPPWPLREAVFVLGAGQRRLCRCGDRLDDGAGERRPRPAAKAFAWACGARRKRSRSGSADFSATLASDAARLLIAAPGPAYAVRLCRRGRAVSAVGCLACQTAPTRGARQKRRSVPWNHQRNAGDRHERIGS